MKYDGIVCRLNKELFLFILNPNDNMIMDGLNISEHECYKNLKDDQLMVVNVIFKDGTEELDNIDLDAFIYDDVYDRNSVFLYIHDILLYSISKKHNFVSLKDLIDDGDLNDIAIECIENSKADNIEMEKIIEINE
ncbi:hypothetical protein M0Q97_08660 [Candidatus Dojkabacteria bacterium]|jgi:hypothetical protein|nr:hypothetical protein [Candidatus Dojkabacteria bacterium]